MKPLVYLLYFEGCPNVNQTRENLKLAFARTNLKAAWEEVNLQNPQTPEKWRGFPSPTILVYGRDVVTGVTSAQGTSSCRFGGAPSAELIEKKLTQGGWRRWIAMLSAVSAAGIGLFPAAFCPACYPALAGLLSAIGLGALVSDAILKPITIALLILALAGMAWQVRRTHQYFLLLIGILGALAMYTGMYLIFNPFIKWCGISALVGTSLWNLASRKSPKDKGGSPCPACKMKGGENNAKA